MTTQLTCTAPAKVNLCLFVGPEDAGGRHELVTVYESLELADTLIAQTDPGLGSDQVDCAGVEGPNLALKALTAYREETGWDGPPLLITIAKRIPVAGGMAGGSADAAAALRLAAALAGDTDRARLHRIAATLGADVPSQVDGGRMIGTGDGRVLRRSPVRSDWEAVVVPVDGELSAGAVFERADRLTPPRDAESLTELGRAVLAAERSGAGAEHAGLAINDLQTAARVLCPPIDDALEILAAHRPEQMMVSGSGPTVFGLFEPGRAGAVAAAIGRDRPAIATRPDHDRELREPRPA